VVRLWKVLGENGEPCHGGLGAWPLPGKGEQWGAWRDAEPGPLRPCCATALHGCRDEDLIDWLGPRIHPLEFDGEPVVHANKVYGRRARIGHAMATWTPRTARLLACDYAYVALLAERERGREPHPDLWQAVSIARAYALGRETLENLAAARTGAARAMELRTSVWTAEITELAAWAAEAAAESEWEGWADAASAVPGAAWAAARTLVNAQARAAEEAARADWEAAAEAKLEASAWMTARLLAVLAGDLHQEGQG
jgi:hypothetical protein